MGMNDFDDIPEIYSDSVSKGVKVPDKPERPVTTAEKKPATPKPPAKPAAPKPAAPKPAAPKPAAPKPPAKPSAPKTTASKQTKPRGDSLIETPVKETPVKETPAKQTPRKATPAKATPAKATPKKEIPVKETPVRKTNNNTNRPAASRATANNATNTSKASAANKNEASTTSDAEGCGCLIGIIIVIALIIGGIISGVKGNKLFKEFKIYIDEGAYELAVNLYNEKLDKHKITAAKASKYVVKDIDEMVSYFDDVADYENVCRIIGIYYDMDSKKVQKHCEKVMDNLIPPYNSDHGGSDLGDTSDFMGGENVDPDTTPTDEPVSNIDNVVDILLPEAMANTMIVNNAKFEVLEGEIVSEDVYDSFSYTAGCTGFYTITLSDMMNGFRVNVIVKDEYDNTIKENWGLASGESLSTIYLEAGSTYEIDVMYYEGTGNYKLSVGAAKEKIDLSDIGAFSDSIEFAGQNNYYTFTAENTGFYRFDTSNMRNGFSINIMITDMGDYEVGSCYGLSNNDGLTVWLDEGNTYNICIGYNGEFGNFDMTISRQITPIYIDARTSVNDIIYYTNQQNMYTFKADRTGTCKYTLSGMVNGFNVLVKILDPLDYEVAYNDYVGNGFEGEFEVEEGKEYRIFVIQRENVGSLTFSLY